jgi:hypothetical protein
MNEPIYCLSLITGLCVLVTVLVIIIYISDRRRLK